MVGMPVEVGAGRGEGESGARISGEDRRVGRRTRGKCEGAADKATLDVGNAGDGRSRQPEGPVYIGQYLS